MGMGFQELLFQPIEFHSCSLDNVCQNFLQIRERLFFDCRPMSIVTEVKRFGSAITLVNWAMDSKISNEIKQSAGGRLCDFWCWETTDRSERDIDRSISASRSIFSKTPLFGLWRREGSLIVLCVSSLWKAHIYGVRKLTLSDNWFRCDQGKRELTKSRRPSTTENTIRHVTESYTPEKNGATSSLCICRLNSLLNCNNKYGCWIKSLAKPNFCINYAKIWLNLPIERSSRFALCCSTEKGKRHNRLLVAVYASAKVNDKHIVTFLARPRQSHFQLTNEIGLFRRNEIRFRQQRTQK